MQDFVAQRTQSIVEVFFVYCLVALKSIHQVLLARPGLLPCFVCLTHWLLLVSLNFHLELGQYLGALFEKVSVLAKLLACLYLGLLSRCGSVEVVSAEPIEHCNTPLQIVAASIGWRGLG